MPDTIRAGDQLKAIERMDIHLLIDNAVTYAQANPLGSGAVGIILLYLLFRRPKIFLILVVLAIAGIGFMQVFGTLDSSGITEKDFRSLGEVK